MSNVCVNTCVLCMCKVDKMCVCLCVRGVKKGIFRRYKFSGEYDRDGRRQG